MMGLLHSLFILAYLFMFAIVCFCYTKVAYTIKTKLIQTNGKNNTIIEHADQNECSFKDSATLNPSENTFSTKETVLGKLNTIRKNKIVPLTEVSNMKNSHLLQPESQGALFDQTCGTSTDADTSQSARGHDVSGDFSPRRSVSIQNKRPEKGRKSQICKKAASDARVDRTTKIMFAVTLVFLLSWIPSWTVYFYLEASGQRSVYEEIFILFARKAYLINTFMNPIFYIWLSSAFKEKTRNTLKNLRCSFHWCCSRM